MRSLVALVVALLSCAAGTSTAAAWSGSPRLDEVASWLSQRPVQVRCLTEAESATDLALLLGAEAYVEIDAVSDRPLDFTVFKHGYCEKLTALAENRWRGRYSLSALGWAVLVLTHESGHMRGWGWWRSEAKVNFWALRHSRYTALRLGASEDLAWAIRSWAMYHCRNQPAEYRRHGCSLGGP